MATIIAGIDVHKCVLMVVLIDAAQARVCAKQRFQTSAPELNELKLWLQNNGATEVVMESTAQYWRPVWNSLETVLHLHLAQAWSNRAPRGKKNDFKDAERLARRYIAGELTLSFVPDAKLRELREFTRRRKQLVKDSVRIQNHIEALLEQMSYKLSTVVSDLAGASGRRIMSAISTGTTDVEQLILLADARLKCTDEQLRAALTGSSSLFQRKLLGQHLEQLALVDKQLLELEQLAGGLFLSETETLARLSEIPGIRVTSAQQILAEIGPKAAAFATPGQLSSWIGVCPGTQESAETNQSGRSTKGNPYIRSTLCQVTQAAVRTKNSIFQLKFNRLVTRLGFAKALWAVAHHMAVVIWKVVHQGIAYVEYGGVTTPAAAKRRLQRIRKELRALGYSVELIPISPATPVETGV